MRKLWFLTGIIILSGCLTMRSYTKEEPRKDLDIEGNRGYLLGEVEDEPKENKFGDTRTISVVEVEFGPRSIKKPKKEGATVETAEVITGITVETAEVITRGAGIEPIEEVQYYTIQNDDTLQKISYKFYGTTRKWNFLYEANKDVLKSPDKLRPGVKIKILPLKK